MQGFSKYLTSTQSQDSVQPAFAKHYGSLNQQLHLLWCDPTRHRDNHKDPKLPLLLPVFQQQLPPP